MRRAARNATPKGAGRGTSGKIILVLVALCLTASGLTLAGLRRLGGRHAAAPHGAGSPAAPAPAPPTPVSFSPASPAKEEYVYAGGRLVATEEPALVPGPGNLRFVHMGISGSATTGYLRWDDTTENETGFVIESQRCSRGCTAWAQYGQMTQNVITYNTPSIN